MDEANVDLTSCKRKEYNPADDDVTVTEMIDE